MIISYNSVNGVAEAASESLEGIDMKAKNVTVKKNKQAKAPILGGKRERRSKCVTWN
jgi:hypothetical protein